MYRSGELLRLTWPTYQAMRDTDRRHTNAHSQHSIVQRLQATLPWFRIVFGVFGVVAPRLLGRYYGIFDPDGDGPNEVAIRYACIRAFGLGIGELTASPAQRRQWQRVGLLVDTVDTIMVLHAGVTGRISKRKACGMLSGTALGMVVGLLTASQEDSARPQRHED